MVVGFWSPTASAGSIAATVLLLLHARCSLDAPSTPTFIATRLLPASVGILYSWRPSRNSLDCSRSLLCSVAYSQVLCERLWFAQHHSRRLTFTGVGLLNYFCFNACNTRCRCSVCVSRSRRRPAAVIKLCSDAESFSS